MEFLEVELFESVQILDVPSSRSEGAIRYHKTHNFHCQSSLGNEWHKACLLMDAYVKDLVSFISIKKKM